MRIPIRSWILPLAVVLASPVNAQSSGMLAAAGEISAFITLIKAAMAIMGVYATGWAIVKLANNNPMGGSAGPNGRANGAYLMALLLGILMISFSYTTSMLSGSYLGGERNSEVNKLRANISGRMSPNPEALEEYVSSSEYTTAIGHNAVVPLGVIKIALMMAVAGGFFAIAAALRIAWVALVAGSEMGGTSLAHRSGEVGWRIVGGVALINIHDTLGWLSGTALTLIAGAAGG